MGRRPNPVIVEYFERGEKLADNSNRYHHRCKACGEDFPKGRIDSLIAHLTKKCQAISQQERLNACMTLNGFNSNRTQQQQGANSTNGAVSGSAPSSAQGPGNVALPRATHYQLNADNTWSALETLAEASIDAEASRQVSLPERGEGDAASPSQRLTQEAAQSRPSSSYAESRCESDTFEQSEHAGSMQVSRAASASREEELPYSRSELRHSHQGMHHGSYDGSYQASYQGSRRASQQGSQQGSRQSSNQGLPQDSHPASRHGSHAGLQYSSHQSNEEHHGQHEHHGRPEHQYQHTHQAEPDYHDEHQGRQGNQSEELSTQEKWRRLHPDDGDETATNLSVAAAAAARMHPLLNREARPHQLPLTGLPNRPVQEEAGSGLSSQSGVGYASAQIVALSTTTTARAEDDSEGRMTSYQPNTVQSPADVSHQSQMLASTLSRGGRRMETTLAHGSRRSHTRSRFDAVRRQEVRDLRSQGACARCRILRKTCSKGTPCDACQKVLAPRIWHTGCIRMKLSQLVEHYSTTFLSVLTQRRINEIKAEFELCFNGVRVEASQFRDLGIIIMLRIQQGGRRALAAANVTLPQQMMLLDLDSYDVPNKLDEYMRKVLPEVIRRQPAGLVRLTLEHAVKQTNKHSHLQLALDLFVAVELMNCDKQWTFILDGGPFNGFYIKDEDSTTLFANFSSQLSAAMERKAAKLGNSLLERIQRSLQDGKAKLGFPMFLTSLVLVMCVEKTTWTFKSWEARAVPIPWPTDKGPDVYVRQGPNLCDLLRMLLGIRKVLPTVVMPAPHAPIEGVHQDAIFAEFYKALNVTPMYLKARHESEADVSDPRSLELKFCAPLFLPWLENISSGPALPAPGQASPAGPSLGPPGQAPPVFA